MLYREKESIHFFLGEGKTLERDFIKKLWERPFWGELKNEAEDTLRLFNNACYICTRVFYDDFPPSDLKEYEKIAIDGHGDSVWKTHIVPVTMALVVNWLSSKECQELTENRGLREDVEELCRRIYVSIENNSDLPLESKEDFQALIIEEHQLPSGFINNGSFQRNLLTEALESPSFSSDDLVNSQEFLLDVLKNPDELIAAFGPNSPFSSKIQANAVNTEDAEKAKCNLWESLNKIFRDNNEQSSAREKAFNAQTGSPCFTNRQMTILMTAVGRITEKDNPPGKTTLGDIVEKIAGYGSTTSSIKMRGPIPSADIEAVASAIESKFPNLAAEVRKL